MTTRKQTYFEICLSAANMPRNVCAHERARELSGDPTTITYYCIFHNSFFAVHMSSTCNDIVVDYRRTSIFLSNVCMQRARRAK